MAMIEEVIHEELFRGIDRDQPQQSTLIWALDTEIYVVGKLAALLRDQILEGAPDATEQVAAGLRTMISHLGTMGKMIDLLEDAPPRGSEIQDALPKKIARASDPVVMRKARQNS
jgi:hypothetical protein